VVRLFQIYDDDWRRINEGAVGKTVVLTSASETVKCLNCKMNCKMRAGGLYVADPYRYPVR
jgi:hypothetical protein